MQKIIRFLKQMSIETRLDKKTTGALALSSPFLILAVSGLAPLMPYLVIGLAILVIFSQKNSTNKDESKEYERD